jgi:hypothetical protein
VLVRLIVVTLCALCGACDSIPLPASDSTPPTISWSVFNKTTGTTTDFAGNGGPLDVKPGDGVEVTCTAKDTNGGVHALKVEGTFSGDLRDGYTVNNQPWDLENMIVPVDTDNKVLNPQNNKVLIKVSIFKDVTPSNIAYGNSPLNEPFHPWVGTLTLTATAENYYQGVTTATLELAVKP